MAERTVVKEVPNAVLYSDGSMLVKNVRWSYPHCATPSAGGIDKVTKKPYPGTYSLVGLMYKKTHGEAKNLIKGEIEGVLKEKNKGAGIKADNWFMRDGNQSGKDVYLDTWTVSCRETLKRPPSVRGFDGRTKLVEADEGFDPNKEETIYGGCWGNMLIRPWWQDNENGKRVNANFWACQIIPANGRPNEPFGDAERISEDEIDSVFENQAGDSDWESTSGDRDEVDTGGL